MVVQPQTMVLVCHLQTFVGILEEDGKSAFLDPFGQWMPEQRHIESLILGLVKLYKQSGDGKRMGRTQVFLQQ